MSEPGAVVTQEEIAALVRSVDYSEALTITASADEVREACREARRFGFRSVAAFPARVPLVAQELGGSRVLTLLAVGFPCGGNTTRVKCLEAEEGLKNGGNDLDMVMDLAAFKEGRRSHVAEDIRAVMEAARPFGVPFKVIIEVGALTDQELVDAGRLVSDCGADFVKTCTGFGPGRATIHAISLLRGAVHGRTLIKASGGVAGIEDGVFMMRAGASVVAMRRMLPDQLRILGWPES